MLKSHGFFDIYKLESSKRQCSSIEKDDMIHARNFLHLHVVSSENTKPTNYIRLLSLSCIYTSYIQANRGGVELAWGWEAVVLVHVRFSTIAHALRCHAWHCKIHEILSRIKQADYVPNMTFNLKFDYKTIDIFYDEAHKSCVKLSCVICRILDTYVATLDAYISRHIFLYK